MYSEVIRLHTHTHTHIQIIFHYNLLQVIFKIYLFFLEGKLLYSLLFSVKPQHESAIGINISLRFQAPSYLPPYPTPLG